MDLKYTPLAKEHERLAARMGPFGGWYMPIQYKEGIIAEHLWTRLHASLFDICHMGEFLIKGTLAQTGLDRVLTMRLKDMSPGMCRYGFILGNDGGIIDDAVIYKIRDDEWFLVVNAATIDGDEAHLKRHLNKNAALDNMSSGIGKLDLQGPESAGVLKNIAGERILQLGYYTFSHFNVLGEEIIISRTGYTGELGYELYIRNEKVAELWEKLLADPRVKPAGLGSRDTLRLEACLPLYGQDVDIKTTPIEAGFERFVDFEKDFIGKEALVKIKREGTRRVLTAFKTDSRRAPRHNYAIESGGKNVGVVTSGSFAPSIGIGVGLGYIKPELNIIDKDIELTDQKVRIGAKITGRPFYKKGSARISACALKDKEEVLK